MSFAALLSEDVLPELSSRRSFDAGREYFEAGRVRKLDAGSEHVRAKVTGSAAEPYTTRMRLTPTGQMHWACTCPYAQEGSFCKHLVATALAWHQWNGTASSRPVPVRPTLPAQHAPSYPRVIHTVEDVDAAVEALIAVQMGRAPANPGAATHALPGAGEREPLRWVRPGTKVTFAGVEIDGGLFYVGSRPTGLRAIVPHSLLDPRHRVAPVGGDSHHWLGGPYPDYISLTETGRRVFVRWLAQGRQDAWANINYVQLFFSGLEFRVIAEGHLPEFAEDRPLIQAELARLLSVYGARMPERLRRAMHNLRDWLLLGGDKGGDALAAVEHYVKTPGQASAQQVQIAMALAARRGDPLDTRLAFEWALTDAKAAVRGYVLQYPKALYRCFESLVHEHIPEGLPLAVGTKPLRLTYAPLSTDLAELVTPPFDLGDLKLADPSPSLQRRLTLLITAGAGLLEAYSYFCVRNPGQADSLEANLLLPVRAMPPAVIDHIRGLAGPTDFAVRRLADVLGGFISGAPTDADQLAMASPHPRLVESLCNGLENLGIGMEPCGVRLPRQVNADTQVCLFSLDGSVDNDQTRLLYDCMLGAVRLVLSVLQAAPANRQSSLGFVAEWLAQATSVPPSLLRRMRARAELEMLGPWSMAGVRKSLGDLPDTLEPWLLQGLLGAAQVHPDQATLALKALQKAYKALDRDPSTVFGDLHAQAARPRGSLGAGRTAAPATGGFSLDAARLASLQAETASTDQLLAAIFVDEPEPALAPTAATPLSPAATAVARAPQEATAAAARRLWNLDDVHSTLAYAILEHSSWSRDELKALAKRMGRMLDGALERINDAAFDAVGIPLCEGEDPVDVNPEILDLIAA